MKTASGSECDSFVYTDKKIKKSKAGSFEVNLGFKLEFMCCDWHVTNT